MNKLKFDDRVLTSDNLNGRIKEISSQDIRTEPILYTVLLDGNMGSKKYLASQLVLKETSSK